MVENKTKINQNKKSKKYVGVASIALSLMLTGTASYVLGSQSGEKQIETPKTSQSSLKKQVSASTTGYDTRKIAVVNLDEGISKGGKIVNYASELAKYPSDNFHNTSIDDAKRGLLTGDYGAYVVIPAIFSENVESLNKGIQKAQINYSVSNQLESNTKLDVKDEVNEFVKQLNQNVSYIYVDSILTEFQGTQSTISTVLVNNDEGNKALSIVEPADILNYMEVPELKQPDAFVEAIDISDELSKNSELLAGVVSDYQEGITKGQETATEIVKDGGALTDDVNVALSNIGNRKIAVDEEGNFTYQGELSNTIEGLTQYLEAAANSVSKNDIKIPQAKSLLESGKYYYDGNPDTPSPYDSKVKNLVDYFSSLVPAVASEEAKPTTLEIIEVPASVNEETGEITPGQIVLQDPVDGTVASYNIQIVEIEGQSHQMLSLDDTKSLLTTMKDSAKIPKDLELVIKEKNGDDEGNVADLSKEAVENRITSEFSKYGSFVYEKNEETRTFNEIDQGDAAERLTEALESLNNIVSFPVNHKDHPLNSNNRTKEINSIQKDLKTNVVDKIRDETVVLNNDLQSSSAELRQKTSDYSQVINSYNPFSYLDQPAIQGNFAAMQGNNTSVQEKSTTQLGKMSENMADTYKVFGENQVAMLDGAKTATEKGTEKVTNGLASAKEVLAEVMTDNYGLLQPITTKLAYTKTGDVPNQSVYQYIVSPLLVSNLTDGKQVANNSDSGTTTSSQSTGKQASVTPEKDKKSLAIPLIGGLVAIVLVGLGVILTLSKTKKNKKTW